MSEAAVTTPIVSVRPRGGLIGVGLATVLLATSPLYGVLYWLAVPRGLLWPTVATHLTVAVASLAVGFRQLNVFVEVRDGRLRGNGIFSPVEQVELNRIAHVDLVATYVGLRPNPVQQLLVRDSENRRVFRMRGNFWGNGALTEVAAALPVAPTVIKEPIDLPDFFRRYPGSAYWFENRPAVSVIGIVLGVAAVVAVAAGAIALSGEPFAV